MRTSVFLGSILIVVSLATLSMGDVIVVSGKSTGRFGAPVGGSFSFQLAHNFAAAGEVITLDASGMVDIGGGTRVGPDGANFLRSPFIGGFPEAFSPLEERLLDMGGIVPTTNPDSIYPLAGALIGAFVDSTRTSAVGFQPLNSDFVPGFPGIDSQDLFFIGAGVSSFIAPDKGTLFLGVNEGFPNGNGGAFMVTVNSVPEPSSSLLFGIGAIGLLPFGYRRRKPTALEVESMS